MRSLFWRYYAVLGRLTLLNAVWGGLTAATVAVLRWLGQGGLPSGGAWVLGSLTLSVFIVLSAGFARVVFGAIVGTGFRWEDFPLGIRRFGVSTWFLAVLWAIPLLFLLNNLDLYVRGAIRGSWFSLGLALLDLCFLLPLALSSLWFLPVLFFREDGLLRAVKRSLLIVVGHPIESLALASWAGLLVGLYWAAPVLALLLGGGFLMAAPCAALEKLMWGYRITFQGRPIEDVQKRWDVEAGKGWRDILRPWESRNT